MITNPVNGTNSNSTAAAVASSTSGVGSLNMGDFLKLMTTQLQHQDPMNPTDSSTFLAELSQMSTVQGITSMQSSLSGLSDTLLKTSAIASASLVGKNVLAAAGASAYNSGDSLSGAVKVPSGATSVMVKIANAAGTVIKTLSVPATAGMQGFTWDGTDASGGAAPSGIYTFTAGAAVAGSSAAAPTYLAGTVASVSIDPTGAGVTLNTPQLGSVALRDVNEIG